MIKTALKGYTEHLIAIAFNEYAHKLNHIAIVYLILPGLDPDGEAASGELEGVESVLYVLHN